jgi:Ca2+-binding RTX toxin-like protein
LLDGGVGADTMAGGANDDTYVVDNIGDVVKETLGAGIDIVRSSITHTLTFSVDHLVLTGSGVIDGTGNTLNNAITGNARANELDGQLGLDTLTGGLGADHFTFSTKLNGATNVDVIDDYSVAADSIVLKQTAFAGLALGALDADAFVIGAAAVDKEDRIIYNQNTGTLLFDRDGLGTKFTAVQFATLNVSLAITNSEFTII